MIISVEERFQFFKKDNVSIKGDQGTFEKNHFISINYCILIQ